ncbi:hypothetical protein [Nocardia sp. NRRL S-836]|uniref:hypothetical protein n=1 Tax=Nocardia sp. NRRL S-836 TaxID=1519492 RepID=UPI0006AF3CD1|nr:hypothetical protein [Nocardia sp. NRRL S-836]
MLEPLEEVLRRIRSALRSADEDSAVHDVGELQIAAAAAAELMAAFDRGDHEAVEFHLGLLARQVESSRPVKFGIS